MLTDKSTVDHDWTLVSLSKKNSNTYWYSISRHEVRNICSAVLSEKYFEFNLYFTKPDSTDKKGRRYINTKNTKASLLKAHCNVKTFWYRFVSFLCPENTDIWSALKIRKLHIWRSIVKMETEGYGHIHFYNSGTIFGIKFPYSSNTTTEPTSIEEPFKWTNAEIARLIQIILRPILIIVGTIGNGLTIYIMRKTSLKHLSSCFYMVILALVDLSK